MGDGARCAEVADAVAAGTFGEPDAGTAYRFYAMGCEHADGRSCERLAAVLDGPAAVTALRRACELERPRACFAAVAAMGPDDPYRPETAARGCRLAPDAPECSEVATDPNPRAIPSGAGWYCASLVSGPTEVDICRRTESQCRGAVAAAAEVVRVRGADGEATPCRRTSAAACFTYVAVVAGTLRYDCSVTARACGVSRTLAAAEPDDHAAVSKCGPVR